MKHLIIYSHLNPKSFTKAIVDEVERISTSRGDEFKIIDLYGDGFNPVLAFPDIEHMFMGKEAPDDVKSYQEMVSWADHLTIVYPLWWGQMPAMLKGFVDRVFANGYAFTYGEDGQPKGLLGNRTAQLFINTGSPEEYYESTGMYDAQRRVIDEGVFGFCGIEASMTFFGNVAMGSDELRKGYLASIEKTMTV